MIAALHTIGIFLETGLGIWIFAQAFPRREVWGWKQTVNETVLHFLILGIILLNFADNLLAVWKAGILILWCIGFLIYRCYLCGKEKLKKETIEKINHCLAGIEFIAIAGLLAWNYWMGYISTSMVVIGNMFLPFFYYKYYKCNLICAYIWEVLYSATIQIIRCAYMISAGEIKNKTMLAMNCLGEMHTYTAVLMEGVILIVLMGIVQYLSVGQILKRALNVYKVQCVLLAASEAFILITISDFGLNGIRSQDVNKVLTITAVLILVVLFFLICLLKKIFETENQLLNVRNAAIERQYQELRMAYEQNRCLVHDEKHRMQYLDECFRNGEIERGLAFLEQCMNNTQIQSQSVNTGIPTLDFIIKMKQNRMKELSIDFHMKIQVETIPMADEDFVVLMGNLLDNAIESAQQCQIDNRSIMLQMRMVNNLFILMIQNTSMFLPNRKRERFLTSKKDTVSHGWGIQSIRHIVDKYDGKIDFTYDEKMFRVRIMIEGAC